MAKFWKPEMLAPKFAMPETVPLPPLKKPEDGLFVELKKPVPVGRLKGVQSLGPRLAVSGIPITVEPSGSPMLPVINGPVPVIGGIVMDVIVPSRMGIGPPMPKWNLSSVMPL
ncbi:hypothetical protein LAUMK191_02110 [Mycobacterium attenuatum]|nr:hypothetical protein LAUMK191_02110 [Mycobacterium attenuatum]